MYDKVSKLGWIKNDRAEVSKNAKSLFRWGFCRVPGHLATKLSRHRQNRHQEYFSKVQVDDDLQTQGKGVIRIQVTGMIEWGKKSKAQKIPGSSNKPKISGNKI